MLKFMLTILDGYGLREERTANAAKLANTPTLDKLFNTCPMVPLQTSGKAVGLPDGVMGNSEVGHMNMGAGRVVRQDLVRINDDIQADTLKNNPNLLELFKTIKDRQSTLHFIGLFSDGGVHSHLDHLKYLLTAAKKYGVPNPVIHAITDGRDTSPTSGIKYIQNFESFLAHIDYGRIASICGRYWAMDRDNRWDRVEKAYRLYIRGDGEQFDDAEVAMKSSYDKNIMDEFIEPKVIGSPALFKNGDGVLAFNYRADRMREITRTFTEKEFSEFSVDRLDLAYVSMTQYQESFNFPVLFPSEELTNIFPEILAKNGLRQLRIAETEKYAHVTYFFNGGDEKLFKGEARKLIPSPKVATYDLQPEMSANEVTDAVIEAILSDRYEAVILNFANPDMVGHTGVLSAAISAMETVDVNLSRILEVVSAKKATMFLTADHGNLEMMIDPETNQVHTAHTTLPVPFILISPDPTLSLLKPGKLADIAPTILDFLKLEIPAEMNGESLLVRS